MSRLPPEPVTPPASPPSPKLYPQPGIYPLTLPVTFLQILEQMLPVQGSLSLLLWLEIILHCSILSKASLLCGIACNDPLTGVKSCLHHVLAISPCPSYLAFLCLHFQNGDSPDKSYFFFFKFILMFTFEIERDKS